jgi:hypothetical protein
MTLRTVTFNPTTHRVVPVAPNKAWLERVAEKGVRMGTDAHIIEDVLAAVPDTLPGVIEHSGEPSGPVELQDNHWYMVRLDDGVGEIEAPAKYKSNVDCWYSYEFSGIPTRHLEVLWEVRPHVTAPAQTAQPVERQELSDEDIGREWVKVWSIGNATQRQVAFARAIIAADREQA